MLNIFFGSTENEIFNPSVYFDNRHEPEWLVSELSKDMIRDVDKSEVVSAHIIESPVLGAITPKELSGGVKVLILMFKDDSFTYNISNCGDNCAKWILDIAGRKDITVYLRHIMKFPEPFEIKINNIDRIVHTYKEYVHALSDSLAGKEGIA